MGETMKTSDIAKALSELHSALVDLTSIIRNTDIACGDSSYNSIDDALQEAAAAIGRLAETPDA